MKMSILEERTSFWYAFFNLCVTQLYVSHIWVWENKIFDIQGWREDFSFGIYFFDAH